MQELLIQSLEIDWSEIDARDYLRSIHAIQAIERLEFHSPVTFFAGENGSGKSTLLEAIAVAQGFNPEGGTKNYSFSTYDSHSGLAEALRLVRGARRAKWGYFSRAESFYNVATQEENYAELQCLSAGYHRKSHGESLLALAQQEFHPQGLYLLDEPEAALSPQRQMSLLVEIVRCAAQGSQFIIASIRRFYWRCRRLKFCVLMQTASVLARMKKQKAIGSQSCFSTTASGSCIIYLRR